MVPFLASPGQGDFGTVAKVNTGGQENICYFHLPWQFHLHLSIVIS